MSKDDEDMRDDYGDLFGKGVRGKYYKLMMKGTNVVLLDRDVARVFKDSESVNRALRGLIQLSKRVVPATSAPRSRKSKTSTKK